MSDKDLAIGVTALPTVGNLRQKPSYLITLEHGKSVKRFITMDKPEIQNGFVQAKGIYSNLEEDEIVQKYMDLLTESSKELILEMMFPVYRVVSIRSLVFRAK
jgi:hypothetical protein